MSKNLNVNLNVINMQKCKDIINELERKHPSIVQFGLFNKLTEYVESGVYNHSYTYPKSGDELYEQLTDYITIDERERYTLNPILKKEEKTIKDLFIKGLFITGGNKTKRHMRKTKRHMSKKKNYK